MARCPLLASVLLGIGFPVAFAVGGTMLFAAKRGAHDKRHPEGTRG